MGCYETEIGVEIQYVKIEIQFVMGEIQYVKREIQYVMREIQYVMREIQSVMGQTLNRFITVRFRLLRFPMRSERGISRVGLPWPNTDNPSIKGLSHIWLTFLVISAVAY